MCVKLKAGKEKIASRLETRLYAAYKSATTEFNKEEGISFNGDDGILYVAMSRLEKAMLDNDAKELGGPNHIRLGNVVNKCGVVYGMDVQQVKLDFAGRAIDSNYVVGNMRTVIAGEPTDYTGTVFEGNTCSVNSIAAPDNLSYLNKYGMLVIGEDTKSHQNDMVWAYNVNTKELERIATTPYGSETTSPFWHTNINGFGYLTLVTQHPYGESDGDKAVSDADLESYIGYIGPFPALD